MPDLSQPSVVKVSRWLIRLSSNNYVFYDISGNYDVCSDPNRRQSVAPTVRIFLTVLVLLSTTDEDSS